MDFASSLNLLYEPISKWLRNNKGRTFFCSNDDTRLTRTHSKLKIGIGKCLISTRLIAGYSSVIRQLPDLPIIDEQINVLKILFECVAHVCQYAMCAIISNRHIFWHMCVLNSSLFRLIHLVHSHTRSFTYSTSRK